MKKIILILMLIATAGLYSCFTNDDAIATIAMTNFVPPYSAELTVRDVRVRGFTLEWTEPDDNGNEFGYEFAIAVSRTGNIEDFETAAAHGNIVLNFTPASMLNGTYRITGLIPGHEYQVALFVRARNVRVAEYLRGSVRLPHLGDVGFNNVWINGREVLSHGVQDRFAYYRFLYREFITTGPMASRHSETEFYFTYDLMRGNVLYIDGVRIADDYATLGIRLTPYEPLEVTVLHERTGTKRDYTIYVGSRCNGLPVVILNTSAGRRIESRSRTVPAHLTIIDSAANPLGIGLYDGPIDIRGRGNSSWGMPKQGWSFSLPESTQILDMAPGRHWAFIANFADKSLMRNHLAYEFARDLGMAFAAQTRFVDLILNGDFMGTYTITERVRIGEGRLNLPRVTVRNGVPDAHDPSAFSYVIELTARNRLREGQIWFTTPILSEGYRYLDTPWGFEGSSFIVRQPSREHRTPEVLAYIRDYVVATENALFGPNFTCPDRGFRAYLDMASFIDWYLVNELFRNVDGDFRLSTYLHKPPGGKLYMGPVWDFDIAAGNANYRGGYRVNDWYIRTSTWFRRLFECEGFYQEFADRWNYLMANGYFDRFFQRIDYTEAKLARSAEMNFQRWNILGRWVWPNVAGYQYRTTYQCEVEQLRDWLTRRVEWMDNEINYRN